MPYVAYLRMLGAVTVDARSVVPMLRPVVRRQLPWLLDCSAVRIDRADATSAA